MAKGGKMSAPKQSELLKILKEHARGIDDLSIIPLIDLSGPLRHVLTNLERGLIPRSYRWSREKTEKAYTYNGYREWGKSIILAAKYYLTDERYPYEIDPGCNTAKKPPVGTISRFTWRNNYEYLTGRISELLCKLEELFGKKIRYRVSSNYTSLPEKVLFASSGLASFGKNSLLIHKKMGSYFVIGEAVTDIDVEFDSEIVPKAPDFSICGKCRLCMEACPSGAILEEGTIDINRCFQYLSQNLLQIPREHMERWGKRLYGCSNCLEACPYNSGLLPWAEKHNTGFVGPGMDLLKVLSLNEDEWRRTFSNNQIGMRDRLAIVKNAIISLGNSGYRKCFETLREFLEHENPVIRICSAWAIYKINPAMSKKILQKKLLIEKDPLVRAEIKFYLDTKPTFESLEK